MNKNNCGLIAKLAAFFTAGAGLVYLLKNYEIEFTIKKKYSLNEEDSELYEGPEYLDVEGAYVTAGTAADRYISTDAPLDMTASEEKLSEEDFEEVPCEESEAEEVSEAVEETVTEEETVAEEATEAEEAELIQEEAATVTETEEAVLDKAARDFDDDDDYDKKEVEGVSYQKL